MDSYDVLVVILSITLAIFLVLAIIFMVFLIRIARRVNEITEKARNAADSVETAAKVFAKGAGPAVFTKMVAGIVETFKDRARKEKK